MLYYASKAYDVKCRPPVPRPPHHLPCFYTRFTEAVCLSGARMHAFRQRSLRVILATKRSVH